MAKSVYPVGLPNAKLRPCAKVEKTAGKLGAVYLVLTSFFLIAYGLGLLPD